MNKKSIWQRLWLLDRWGELSLFSFAIMGILSILIIATLVIRSDNLSCEAIATKMEVEHTWHYKTGCMIKYKDQWIPLHNFRTVNNV